MLSGANAFKSATTSSIRAEDKMQQCYMLCGKRKITIRQPQVMLPQGFLIHGEMWLFLPRERAVLTVLVPMHPEELLAICNERIPHT